MRILILGSSGQIGSGLCKYYTDKGIEVDTFDIVDSEYEDLRIHNNNILEHKMKNSDFVFFLAFDIGGSRYLKKHENTFEYVDNNMKIMVNTFNCLKKTNKPFIFASSQMSNMDWSSYGSLKRVGEWYTNNMGGVVVKFWNVYGIESDSDKYGVVSDFIMKAHTTGKIEMITDGFETREFLFTTDACSALDTIRQNYNNVDRERELCVTSFEETEIREVAHQVSRYIPCEIIPTIAKDEVQKDKRNKADTYILNFWKPKISLAKGIGIVAMAYNTIQPPYDCVR